MTVEVFVLNCTWELSMENEQKDCFPNIFSLLLQSQPTCAMLVFKAKKDWDPYCAVDCSTMDKRQDCPRGVAI